MPPSFRAEAPYDGAKYSILIPLEFDNPEQVPAHTVDPHLRFVGREVRKKFHPDGDETREKVPYLGKVISYSKARGLYKITYEDGDGEDLDFVEMTGILIQHEAYGDHPDTWGFTRDERAEALHQEVVMLTMLEESMRRVSTDSCYAFVAAGGAQFDKNRPVLYDDEPQNAKEVERHPERDEIREAARKEVQQWIDMQIGVSLSPCLLYTSPSPRDS